MTFDEEVSDPRIGVDEFCNLSQGRNGLGQESRRTIGKLNRIPDFNASIHLSSQLALLPTVFFRRRFIYSFRWLIRFIFRHVDDLHNELRLRLRRRRGLVIVSDARNHPVAARAVACGYPSTESEIERQFFPERVSDAGGPFHRGLGTASEEPGHSVARENLALELEVVYRGVHDQR